MKRNEIAVLGCLVVFAGAAWYLYGAARSGGDWNSTAITASYVGAQLRELGPDQAALFLAYDIRNNTGADYRLADGPGVVVMSRLKPDGSLSSQEQVKLSYPTLLPAQQQARISIEVQHPFGWPADNDPLVQQKLKAFVNQRIADVQEFVLFDQPDHLQVNFPGAWRELKVSAASSAGER